MSEHIYTFKPAPLSRRRPLCQNYPVLEKVPVEQAAREAPGAMLGDQLDMFEAAVVGCGVAACRHFCYLELEDHDDVKLVNITGYSQSVPCLYSAPPQRGPAKT